MKKLEKLIYKFLDTYVGDNIGNISFVDNYWSINFCKPCRIVKVCSKKNVEIFSIAFFESETLIDGDVFLLGMMIDYFSLGFLEAKDYLISWFYKKYNIRTDEDFIKFIQYKYERRKIGL